jgi:outer membrane receptor for ferrienterochelin and colicins
LIGERHRVSLGGEAEREGVEGATFRGGSPDVNEYDLYAQDEFEITRMITLVAGGRYTGNGQFGSEITPQATLFFKPGNLRARLFYGEGFRAPSLDETSFEFVEPGGFGVVGSPDLKPEESKSISAGVEYYFPQARVGASVFRHRVENLISFSSACTPEEAVRIGITPGRCAKGTNVGETQFQGIEAGAGIRFPGNIALEAGYLYLSATDERTGELLFQRPRSLAKGKLVWDAPLGFSLVTRVRYQGPFGLSDFRRGTPPATNGRIDGDERTDATTEIDLRLAKVIGRATFYVGVDNVTDKERKVVDPTGTVIFDRSLSPRTWYGGARVAF